MSMLLAAGQRPWRAAERQQDMCQPPGKDAKRRLAAPILAGLTKAPAVAKPAQLSRRAVRHDALLGI